jgi:hypothetical protein
MERMALALLPTLALTLLAAPVPGLAQEVGASVVVRGAVHENLYVGGWRRRCPCGGGR